MRKLKIFAILSVVLILLLIAGCNTYLEEKSSDEGKFIVSKKNDDGTWDLYLWDGNDEFERLTNLKATRWINARLSWDKRKLAIVSRDDDLSTLYIMDLDTRKIVKIVDSFDISVRDINNNMALMNWRRNNREIVLGIVPSMCNRPIYTIDPYSEDPDVEMFINPTDIDPIKHNIYNWWPLEDGRMIISAQNGCWSPTLELYIFRLDDEGNPYDVRQLTHNSYYDDVMIVHGKKIYEIRSDNPAGYDPPGNAYTVDYETGEEEKLTHFTGDETAVPAAIIGDYLYINFYTRSTGKRAIYRMNLLTKKLELVKDNTDFFIIINGVL